MSSKYGHGNLLDVMRPLQGIVDHALAQLAAVMLEALLAAHRADATGGFLSAPRSFILLDVGIRYWYHELTLLVY